MQLFARILSAFENESPERRVESADEMDQLERLKWIGWASRAPSCAVSNCLPFDAPNDRIHRQRVLPMSSFLLLLLILAILAPVVFLLGFAGCGATLLEGPVPPRPSTLRIVAVGRTTVTLGWLYPSNTPVTFEVERTREGDSTSDRLLVAAPTVVPDTGELTFVDMNLEPSTFYFYQVRAVRISDDAASALSEPPVSASTLA